MLLLSLVLACPEPTADDKPADTVDTDSGIADTETGDSAAANTAPSAPVITITPAAPNELATLTVTIVTESVDAEGDAVEYRYVWTQNATLVADLTGSTVPPDRTGDGETWTAEVVATDGTLDSPATSATVTIGNSPPTVPVVHIEPAAPIAGETLSLVFDTPANDPNGDVVTQTIQWYQNEVRNLSWDDFASIDGVYVDGGESFRAVVTVSDGLSDALVVEASVVIANTPPEVTSVVVTPDDPKDSEDLSCTVRATDADDGELTTSYRWFRDGVEAVDVGDSDTVPADLTTIGETWECMGIVSDGYDMADSLGDPVEIRDVYGYRVESLVTFTVSEDTAGTPVATGYAEVALQGGGSSIPTSECEIVWSLLGTEDKRFCRGCLYSFDALYTYEAADSSITTGCSTLSMDATGFATFEATRDGVRAYLEGPTMPISAYYSSYRGFDITAYGTGSYVRSYGGYTRGATYGVTTTYDSAGNTVITAYNDYYKEY